MNEERRGPILQHLRELRRRLFLSFLAVIVTSALSFIFAGRIFDILFHPAGDFKPIYINLTEMISTYFKLSLYTGLALALPFIIYQGVMFAAPGLMPKEKKYVYLLMPAVFLLFGAGVTFGYFVLLPPALRFLLNFGSDIATPQITVGNYITTVVTLLFWLGVAFEIPLVLFFLARIRVLNPNSLARRRRFIFVGAFIAAAIITPTFDPMNQVLVAAPIILLFELGIWMGRLAWPHAPR